MKSTRSAKDRLHVIFAFLIGSFERAMALEFSAEGAKVIALDINTKSGKVSAELVKKLLRDSLLCATLK